MPTASLQALLAQSIDYAGMFPPCSLALEPALQNQAEYVHSPEAWMLSTFVLSVDQFEAAAAKVALFDWRHELFDWKHGLRISALGAKTRNTDEFIEALKSAVDKIRSFSAQHADLVSINQLEMPLPVRAGLGLGVDPRLLAKIDPIMNGLDVQMFWEAPPNLAEETIALLTERNSATSERPFGYKLRTGGVTADAIPTSRQIARVLVAAAKAEIPVKFTAGLHHPIRQFRVEVETKMHGFLNVLGAAVLAAEHEWNEQQTSKMLEDENATSFSFLDGWFAWQEWKLMTDRIKARRKFVTSFGTCSFDEPREDLHALNFL
jgi:hypothetical protein